MSAFNNILQALGGQHQQPPQMQMPPPMQGQGQMSDEDMRRMMEAAHPAPSQGMGSMSDQDNNFLASTPFNNMVQTAQGHPQGHGVIRTLLKMFGV